MVSSTTLLFAALSVAATVRADENMPFVPHPGTGGNAPSVKFTYPTAGDFWALQAIPPGSGNDMQLNPMGPAGPWTSVWTWGGPPQGNMSVGVFSNKDKKRYTWRRFFPGTGTSMWIPDPPPPVGGTLRKDWPGDASYYDWAISGTRDMVAAGLRPGPDYFLGIFQNVGQFGYPVDKKGVYYAVSDLFEIRDTNAPDTDIPQPPVAVGLPDGTAINVTNTTNDAVAAFTPSARTVAVVALAAAAGLVL